MRQLTGCVHFHRCVSALTSRVVDGLSAESLHLFLTALSITVESWKLHDVEHESIESLSIAGRCVDSL